jgi:hypothetical protein
MTRITATFQTVSGQAIFSIRPCFNCHCTGREASGQTNVKVDGREKNASEKRPFRQDNQPASQLATASQPASQPTDSLLVKDLTATAAANSVQKMYVTRLQNRTVLPDNFFQIRQI